MGWYDANPVNLNPLSLSDSAKKFVEYEGDANVLNTLAENIVTFDPFFNIV